MALHFLQAGANPPVLPNLLAENPYVFHPSRALTALSFDDVLSGELVSRNVSTLGELFVGFLAYFSQEFDFKSQSISVREARAVAKTTPIEFSKQIYIEEPYNLKNVARAVKKESEPYIKKVIEESYAAICRSKELEPVLTLNVTKATKATMVKESAADSRISGGSPTEARRNVPVRQCGTGNAGLDYKSNSEHIFFEPVYSCPYHIRRSQPRRTFQNCTNWRTKRASPSSLTSSANPALLTRRYS